LSVLHAPSIFTRCGAMAIPKAVFAVALFATFASVLVGCGGDASYPTCDHEDIIKKQTDFMKEWKETCLDKVSAGTITTYAAFESCSCVPWKPLAADMRKYKEPCTKDASDAGKWQKMASAMDGPFELNWNHEARPTTCGVSGVKANLAAGGADGTLPMNLRSFVVVAFIGAVVGVGMVIVVGRKQLLQQPLLG